MTRSGDGVSFFDVPVEIILAPFGDFRFDAVSSWAEIELYAVASGVEIDGDFLNVMCAASFPFPNVYGALLGGIREYAVPAANSCGFAECLFKTWMPVRRIALPSPSDEIMRWAYGRNMSGMTYGYGYSPAELVRKKYGLLSALDEKFPYLLVKFYALHAKDLRQDDMQFVLWLRKRLEKRAPYDSRLGPVLAAMDTEAKRMDRTAMYVR